MSNGKKLARFVALLSVLALPIPSSAQQPDDVAKPAYGTEYAYVSKVQVGNDNYMSFNVAGNFTSAHGCSKPYYARSRYPITDERAKAQMKLAMASFLSRKPVYVLSDGCTAYGHLILSSIQVFEN